MVLRIGFRTFQFHRQMKVPPALDFVSREAALDWLKQLALEDSDVIHRLRRYAAGSAGDPEFHRLTDHAALHHLAILLHLRKILVTVRYEPTASGKPSAKLASAPPAFPLAQRSPRESSSSQPKPGDSPTFSNVNAAALASALTAAAANGAPFCQECTKP
jgi:hypothetical protein